MYTMKTICFERRRIGMEVQNVELDADDNFDMTKKPAGLNGL